MAVRSASLSSADYFRAVRGEDVIDLGTAKIAEPLKLESPETIANRKRVTRNLNGKA